LISEVIISTINI